MSDVEKTSTVNDNKADTNGPGGQVVGGDGGPGAAQGQDPKNVAELTHYIQSMLQQMQDRYFIIVLIHVNINYHLLTHCKNYLDNQEIFVGFKLCQIRSSHELMTCLPE